MTLRPIPPARLDRALELLLDQPLAPVERRAVGEVARLVGVRSTPDEAPARASLADEFLNELMPHLDRPDVLRPARAIALLREMIEPEGPVGQPTSVEAIVGRSVLCGELHRFTVLHGSVNALVKA